MASEPSPQCAPAMHAVIHNTSALPGHVVAHGSASRLTAIVQKLAEQSSIPVGGRLKFFWRQWRKLGAPKKVVRWLRKGYALPFKREAGQGAYVPLATTCPAGLITSYKKGSDKDLALQSKIQELLDKKAIVEVPADQPGFHNRVFLRPKKTGGWRLILDVSQLNKSLVCKTFCMDHAQVIRQAAQAGMWATSVDFSDAYHHIPIKPAHQKFLCFQVNEKRYMYLALPFGLSPAPRVFTSVMSPVKAWARAHKLLMFQYLDDWLNLAHNRTQATQQTLLFVETCVQLGLVVNLEKSELVPTQVITFLGFSFDLVRGMIFPLEEKMLRVERMITKMLAAKWRSVKNAESLRGTLTSLEKAVPWGRLNFRAFQRVVSLALRKGRRPSAQFQLSLRAKQDLHWWCDRSNTLKGQTFLPPAMTLQVQTDASKTGWGANVGHEVISGIWTADESHLHINVLELKAVIKTCLACRHTFKNQSVLFLIDNVTVVAHINKQGGTHSQLLMREAHHLFRIVQELNMHLSAHHIAGALNAVADLASRKGQVLSTEWRLSADAFAWIGKQSKWGPPAVDLFANRLNSQLQRFVSPCPDPQAVAVDALICRWPQQVLYAFPPTVLMAKLVARMRQMPGHHMLVVAPWYPGASWFPLLQSWTVTAPLPLPVTKGMLRQPHWQHLHPDPGRLTLHLWQVKTPSLAKKATLIKSYST